MSDRIPADLVQIGEVADRVGLSLRTVRYYEEAGLVTPCDRSPGGFRLYGDAERKRLEFVKRLKPLGFSLEEMRELIELLDVVHDTGPDDPVRAHLAPFLESVESQCAVLESRLRDATRLAEHLRAAIRDANVESSLTRSG